MPICSASRVEKRPIRSMWAPVASSRNSTAIDSLSNGFRLGDLELGESALELVGAAVDLRFEADPPILAEPPAENGGGERQDCHAGDHEGGLTGDDRGGAGRQSERHPGRAAAERTVAMSAAPGRASAEQPSHAVRAAESLLASLLSTAVQSLSCTLACTSTLALDSLTDPLYGQGRMDG